MADNQLRHNAPSTHRGYEMHCIIPEINANYTFYNTLNANDQDSLNSAAGGNFLDKMPRECLRIIESKSNVCNSRNKAVVAKVSLNSSTPRISPDVAALTTEVRFQVTYCLLTRREGLEGYYYYQAVKSLNLLDLTPTCMTLELADRLISRPIGIAKDVNVKVGVFQFPADFMVVDFEPDPRVPLILGKCFLKTSRALIDVYEGELTLRVDNEAITYNLDQTLRYSVNYNDMTANRIDVVELACEEYFQEVLGFSDVIADMCENTYPFYIKIDPKKTKTVL
ncbi:reverse transcriptase domain-containing protein [Tanacetum coccineum]